jgi:hypothetical protein
MNLTQVLKDLCDQNQGRLTPALVVDKARSKDSVLHDYFIWDDSVAGEKYRLYQASYLIRKVKVVYSQSENDRYKIRAFSNIVTNSDERVYIKTEQALSVPNYREQLLEQCRRDSEAFITKYQGLVEVSEIINAMKKWQQVKVSR